MSFCMDGFAYNNKLIICDLATLRVSSQNHQLKKKFFFYCHFDSDMYFVWNSDGNSYLPVR